MAAVKYWFQNATDARRIVLLLLLTVPLTSIAVAEDSGGQTPGAELAISNDTSPDSRNAGISSPAAASVHSDEQAAETSPGGADDDRVRLAARLDRLATFAATFTQEIQGANGQLLERSSGRVLLQRPLFKWEVDEPFPQVIVTDGDVLKVYDPDLEQLTIRPLDNALEDTPVSLLTRDDVVLSDRFDVTRYEEEAGETFLIVPTSADALYAEIRLSFTDERLVLLNILDQLGQFTQIHFEPDADAAVLQSSDFQLDVPPGTDVIGG